LDFPITSNVIPAYSDRTELKVLNKGDLVRCWWCKEPFIVDEMTAMVTDKYDNKALKCPVCNKIVSVLYYYDSARPATKKDRNMIAQRARRRRLRLHDRDT